MGGGGKAGGQISFDVNSEGGHLSFAVARGGGGYQDIKVAS